MSHVGAALALERRETVEQSVHVKLGNLRVGAHRGGIYDVYGGGKWRAFVHAPDGGQIIGEGSGADEHAAIAAALHAAGVLAREIDAAGDAWRAREVGL